MVLQDFEQPPLSFRLSCADTPRPSHYRISHSHASAPPSLPSPSLYRTAKTANPTKTAIPALTPFATAPPLNGDGVADPPVVVVPEPPVVELVEELEALPLLRVKLAQVRRVALAVWMTMERLPKKEAGPEAVER